MYYQDFHSISNHGMACNMHIRTFKKFMKRFKEKEKCRWKMRKGRKLLDVC